MVDGDTQSGNHWLGLWHRHVYFYRTFEVGFARPLSQTQYTNVDVNWGMACALGSVLLATTLILYAVYRRFAKAELSLG